MIFTTLVSLAIGLSAHAHVDRINDDVWLPLDFFQMHTPLESFRGLIYNPVTGETRSLPQGWTVSNFVSITQAQPWLGIIKPIQKHVAEHDLINIHTGQLFFGGGNQTLQPIEKVTSEGFVARDRDQDRYVWIKLNGERVYFPKELTSVSPNSFSEGLWSATDQNYFPVYVDQSGQVVRPRVDVTLPTRDGWQLLRADGFSEGLALAALGDKRQLWTSAIWFYQSRF